MSAPTVVVGTIGSDAHVIGVTLLKHALEEAGFEVRNLGAQTSPESFVAEADETDADAILVSSLYGHAEQDCEGLHERLADAGVDPVTYIGGNLAVGQTEFEVVRQRFREMGFDRVFETEADLDAVVDVLQSELRVDEQVSRSVRASL